MSPAAAAPAEDEVPGSRTSLLGYYFHISYNMRLALIPELRGHLYAIHRWLPRPPSTTAQQIYL